MTEPRIQYAKTADGVSIAFWTLGQGQPLVQMPPIPWSHIQLEWQAPQARRWYERLARKRMLVRYDGRGSGLSDRYVTDFSLDSCVLDLEAVVDRLGLEKFALFGFQHSGPVAIACAARQPDRLSHLLLWCSFPRGSDFWRLPRSQAFRAIRETDWDLYVESMADLASGGRASEEEVRGWSAFMRECTTPELQGAVLSAAGGFDVTGLLPELRTPTLVLHRRNVPFQDVAVARGLASQIPDARLALLEGTSMMPWTGDTEAVLSAIEEFLDEGEETRGAALAKEDVHTILFTDMESSTALTQRLGDAKAQDLLRTHNTIVRDALKAHGGSEVKHTGDGIMASFPSASQALQCAIAIQRAVAARAEELPDIPLRVRIGLNAGEPVAEESDLFGTAVQLARRICDQAEGGEILASDVVRQLVAGKGFLFSDRGDVVLRGFEDPVRLYEVRWQEEA